MDKLSINQMVGADLKHGVKTILKMPEGNKPVEVAEGTLDLEVAEGILAQEVAVVTLT